LSLLARSLVSGHIAAKKEFDHEKSMTLDSEYKQKYEEEPNIWLARDVTEKVSKNYTSRCNLIDANNVLAL